MTIGLLVLALAGVVMASLTSGDLGLTVSEVARVLFIPRDAVGDPERLSFFVGPFVDDSAVQSGDRLAHIVVHDLRLPRALLGVIAGASLALAGVMLQDTLGNPLAEPGILGLSSGAVVLVAIVTIFGVPVAYSLMPLLALLGGLAAGGVLLVVASLKTDPVRLVLIGAAMTAFLNAVVIIAISIGEPFDIQLLYRFMVGSLANRNWESVYQVLPWAVIGIPLALMTARALNLLQLGDEVAEGLGLPVVRARLLIFVISVVLVASVVSVAGPISFVALLAPHAARRILATPDARLVLPVAALLGAVLLTAADLFARTVLAPVELPVGIFTTLFGGPVLLILIRRELGRHNT
ncbi:MAG: FecCD family ABC transporter permease [Phototrophicaceae bacterium]